MRPLPFIATLILTLAVGGVAGGFIGASMSDGDGAARPQTAGPADVLAALQSGDTERLREIQSRVGAAGAEVGAAAPQSDEPTAQPTAAPAATAAPGAGDPAGTGEATTLTGLLRSVSDSAIVIDGADGSRTTLPLAAGATALTFVSGAADDLEVGQEAVLFGLPGEGAVAARFILAAPAGSDVLDNFAAGAGRPTFGAGQGGAGLGGGQGGAGQGARQGPGGQGAFGGGLAANLLAGPITAVDGGTVTIETERGALSASIDPEGTLLQVLTETPLADLPPDGQVIVTVGAGRRGGIGRRPRPTCGPCSAASSAAGRAPEASAAKQPGNRFLPCRGASRRARPYHRQLRGRRAGPIRRP